MKVAVLILLFVCVVSAMRISPVPGSEYYADDTSDAYHRAVSQNAVCFGLARRTRTQTYGVPFLYNTLTGQRAPMPANLRQVDPAIIAKMERDGWEVRTRRMAVSRPIYFRVRVCCPWDTHCQRSSRQMEQRYPVQNVCENGGRLMVRAGIQTCICPTGFRGQACQYPDLISGVHGAQMGYRGRFRPAPTPRVFTELSTQANLWRQKMMSAQRQMVPSTSQPRLSQKQHVILSSMSGPWNSQVAVWQQRALRARMVELCRRRRLMALRNQRLQAEMMRAMQLRGGNPYAARRQEEDYQDAAVPVSPYRYNQQMTAMRGSAYTNMPRQPMVTSTQGSGNPYSRVRPYVEPTHFGRAVERSVLSPEARTPWDMDPFQKNPAMIADPRTQIAIEKERQLVALAYYRYMRTHKGSEEDMTNSPTMNTVDYPGAAPSPAPLGVDLAAQLPPLPQETPATDDYSMDYTDTQTQQEPDLDLSIGDESDQTTTSVDDESPLGPSDTTLDTVDERPLGPTDVQTSPTEGPLGPTDMAEDQTESPLGPSDIPEDSPDGPFGPSDIPEDLPDGPLGPSDVPQDTTEELLANTDMSEDPTDGPLGPSDIEDVPTEGPLGPSDTVQDPSERPLGPATGEMSGPPPLPTPEEMAKMESCRNILEPEMDHCLADFGLNFAQFMNPDYMSLAKDVCLRSAVVGPCITSRDDVCGQESSQIQLTRKMIQSVIQMMGMVCQQIMARGDTPMPPVPSAPRNLIPPFKQGTESTNQMLTNQMLTNEMPTNEMPTNQMPTNEMPIVHQVNEVSNQAPVSTNQPITASEPADFTNQPEATAEPTNQMPDLVPFTEDTDIPALPPTEKPNHKKFDATKSGVKTAPTATPTVHSAGETMAHHETAHHDKSHDSAEPVMRQEMLILGYPAWLVIALGGLLFLVLLLSGFVCCLCLRRRSKNKKAVELEIVAEPMDEKKLAIIGVPPPLYYTTPVLQNKEEDLSLPPLDLAEDSDDTNHSYSEEDADDESDDKTDVEEKKEKKKVKKDQP